MINSKFERIYNTIFSVISFLPVFKVGWILIEAYSEYINAADPGDIGYKLTRFLAVPILCVLLIALLMAIVGILCIYSGVKYFLFEPEKKPVRSIWNIGKLLIAAVLFTLPGYWSLINW